MLDDKDRIFKNLYGLHDWGLEGARRVAPGTAPRRSSKGPRLDHRRDEDVRPARSWRGRLPDRPEMVVHAEEVGRAAAATSSSTPTNPSPAPARTARSCGTIRICWSKAA